MKVFKMDFDNIGVIGVRPWNNSDNGRIVIEHEEEIGQRCGRFKGELYGA